ncbi:pyrroloquinoline quinone biosynthesis peptide chaperone PqqD [Kutzneria kofuensis]|uniref:Pyrroloquinoline quinone biosynthesis protein D n=1 Tax=Kutzneria kofuensis TaxID=103725 RepID=A0A7W9KFQ6_9PSEU|nr:pyrroloquinoline quinone biosynthesis peptide chaperone PqqD [Kutzneria kofuensis]MBB5891766.1 pyrroloquinoline quinone biosynthesis protein D [Kutzneria kofuensis]
MTSLDSVPRVRRGVRCTYDKTRNSDVVLFPEGVLLLNETAAAVVSRCDGSSSVGDIALALADEFDGVQPDDVIELVDRLVARRVVDVD